MCAYTVTVCVRAWGWQDHAVCREHCAGACRLGSRRWAPRQFPTPHSAHLFACISVHCRRDDGHVWKPVRKDLVFQKHPICISSILVFQPPKQGSDFIDQFGRNSTLAFQGVCPRVLGAMKQRGLLATTPAG